MQKSKNRETKISAKTKCRQKTNFTENVKKLKFTQNATNSKKTKKSRKI